MDDKHNDNKVNNITTIKRKQGRDWDEDKGQGKGQ